MKVGMAAGLTFRNGDRHRVVIGKDTRLSSYMIENALTAGFLSVGLDVLLTGPIPTPGIAMLTRSMRCDLGVMISASHNPYDDNGIKLFGPDGHKLSDEVEAEIEQLIDADLGKRLAAPPDLGRATRIDGAADRYVEFAKRTLPRDLSLEGMRVVIDGANGAGYNVAPLALAELGAEVFAVGVDPDGKNINREVGSTAPAALAAEVRAARRHRDRAGWRCRPPGGHRREGAARGRRPGDGGDRPIVEEEPPRQAGIVVTVMSNLGLERFLAGIGLGLVRTPVGDRYVAETMRREGYNLGGEQSGHIILSDYTTTGDGLVAALQLLAVVKKLDRPVSEVCHRFAPLPQILKSVRTSVGRRPLDDGGIRKRSTNQRPARRPWPAGGARLGHRAGDPRHGRGRRPRNDRLDRRRPGRGNRRSRRLRPGCLYRTSMWRRPSLRDLCPIKRTSLLSPRKIV